jgi:ferrous iron transport protein B
MIFNCLTGSYATVSNYPGTTVEIMTAKSRILPEHEIMDTPGAYSLLPLSEEERVTREILKEAGDAHVLHVVDAKNLRRMLPMTLELLERRLRVILVLNMMDEARHFGVEIDTVLLGRILGVSVVKTVATKGEGITDLGRIIGDGVGVSQKQFQLMDAPEESLTPQQELEIRRARQDQADQILSQCATFPPATTGRIGGALNRLTLNPWTAAPIAFAVLYFGVYQFVGTFGAGTLVDFLETDIYEAFITPYLTAWIEKLIPWPVLQDLFVHDYGVLTLGLRYAVALILPIVGTFFILFSVLEDTGYLPRLALLLDRIFKRIGLNGRAVIPIVLGFGCGTMATMVTRILETKRERIIATLLLGVAIPCSAQLGVIMAMLAGHPVAYLMWCVIIGAIFLTLGTIAARKLPGEVPSFYLELPPLRFPRFSNVAVKTYSRMHWYFLEILPLFLAASVVIWLGNLTGTFGFVVGLIEPVIGFMGLPAEAASSFLFGFFRRDYGAAGLFDLQRDGGMSGRQVFVSVLVITLFLPCIAQFFVMKKERGWRFALLTSASIVVVATSVGVVANFVLMKTGWL